MGGIPSDGQQNDDSSEDSKTLVAHIGGYKVIAAAGTCLMIIAIISVIAIVARKRRNNAKSEMLSDVMAIDLEMPPVADAGMSIVSILIDQVGADCSE